MNVIFFRTLLFGSATTVGFVAAALVGVCATRALPLPDVPATVLGPASALITLDISICREMINKRELGRSKGPYTLQVCNMPTLHRHVGRLVCRQFMIFAESSSEVESHKRWKILLMHYILSLALFRTNLRFEPAFCELNSGATFLGLFTFYAV